MLKCLFDKKIKRKHLLKKIHPDKINFLISKIKNKSKDECDKINFEDEKNI